ncbi:unnamed protein product, partial [Brachionus calyciflorus]
MKIFKYSVIFSILAVLIQCQGDTTEFYTDASNDGTTVDNSATVASNDGNTVANSATVASNDGNTVANSVTVSNTAAVDRASLAPVDFSTNKEDQTTLAPTTVPSTTTTSTTTTTRFRGSCPTGYYISDDGNACIFDFDRLSRNANIKLVTNLMDQLASESEISAKCSLNCPANTNCSTLNGTVEWFNGTSSKIHTTDLIYNLANREFYSFLGESHWVPLIGNSLSCKIIPEFNSTNPSFEIKSSSYAIQLDCSMVNLTAQEAAESNDKSFVLYFDEADTKTSRLKCVTTIPIGCTDTSDSNCDLKLSLEYKGSISKDRVIVSECSKKSNGIHLCNPNDKTFKVLSNWTLADGELTWDIGVSLESKNLNFKNETYELELQKNMGNGNQRDLFSKLILPNITVNFRPSSRPLKYYATCFNDPHCKTFDGVWFELQLPGEFQMYENVETQTRVHVISTRCSPWSWWRPPFCLNKIYLQYFHEIVRIDVANNLIYYSNLLRNIINQPVIFDSQGNARNSIESLQITKNGYGIDIATGYGMMLRAYGYVWDDELYINRYDIIPAKVDKGKTGGIFSKWDDDPSNDVRVLKNGSTVAFDIYNDFLYNTYIAGSNGIPSLANGNYPINSTQAKNSNSFCGTYSKGKCIIGKNEDSFIATAARKRRDVEDRFEIDLNKLANSEALKNLEKMNFNKRYAPRIRRATPTLAELQQRNATCDALAAKVDPSVASESNIDETIENCKNDVVADQYTDYTNGYKNDVATVVIALATSDVSNMDTSGGSPVILVPLSDLCPNNCSDHGNCTNKGVCECETDYSGADCSQYSQAVPSLLSTTQSGIWDLSKGALNDIIFKAKQFISSNENAQFRFTVYYPDINTRLSDGIVKASEVAFNVIYVNLTNVTISQKFFFIKFEATNDGSEYSKTTITLTAADLTRYTCSQTTCTEIQQQVPIKSGSDSIKFFHLLIFLPSVEEKEIEGDTRVHNDAIEQLSRRAIIRQALRKDTQVAVCIQEHENVEEVIGKTKSLKIPKKRGRKKTDIQ